MSEPQCPNGCGELEADHVDIGVGMQRCGPYGCPACHYVEPDARTREQCGHGKLATEWCETCDGNDERDVDEECTCALPSNLRHEHEERRGLPCPWCGRMVR